MLRNNNTGIITRLAKRSLKSSRSKSAIMISAIALSAFMFFTVLTVGSTYFKMQKVQNIRLNGGQMDAYIYGGFTEKQKEVCRNNPDIALTGIEGMAGWVEKSDTDDTVHTSLIWADEVTWNELKAPAREWVKGSYPEKENEVMVTQAALDDCGLGNLDVGDSFTVTYAGAAGNDTKEFIISGKWEGYGDKKVLYVSRTFFEKYGFDLEEYGRGFLYVKYKSPLITDTMQRKLTDSLKLGERQVLLHMSDSAKSVQVLAGMSGIILITCISAYLLIYNILYLSVAGNIRRYGLLQTIGMTGRQIYGLMKKQMIIVGAIGMVTGVVLSVVTSFLIIPWIVKTIGIFKEDIEVVFHPAVLVLCVLLTALTVWLGSRRPAKTATAISPVEALNYRPFAGSKKLHKSGKGNIIWRMAKEQFCKDKKKTTIVILSLAASLSVFLCLITLIESHGARTVVSSMMDDDFTVWNDTVFKEEQSQWVQLLDDEFMSELKENQAVREVHTQYAEQIIVPWEPDFAETYMKAFYDYWMNEEYADIEEDYKQNPAKYYSYMTGIDKTEFEILNSTLETPADEAKFLAGESCILYNNSLDLTMEMLEGDSITCLRKSQPDTSYQFEIAGVTGERYYAELLGITPTIIVSADYMERIIDQPYRYKSSVFYQEQYDEQMEAQLKDMINQSPYAKDFDYDSKIDMMKTVRKAQGNMMGIGIGIIVILALIGVMNYVNTVAGNIQSRQIEIAVMESVGMTESQVRKLLVREGILFAGASLLLTAVIGTGITYVVYQSMNYMQVPFVIPVLPVVVMILFVLIICVSIPLAVYRMAVGRRTVVERVRGI